jgi:EAL domain-containing protein (putative c-di-GMP-specific phosphodiesterase class I)
VDSGGAGTVAAKMLEAFDRSFDIDGQALRTTASIGISLFPADADDASAVLRAADGALSLAKSQGRNQVQYFAPGQNAASRQRIQVAGALQGAQARGELVLHYQPQVDLASGRVTSLEALLRWRQGGRLVSCADFIEVAEDTGLIVPIGEWVLREACRQVKAWRDAGHELDVAVNVSPRQLRRPGFPETVAGALARSGLPPSALELEITENLLMQKTRDNLQALEQLVGMGVRLSIDDFGVGYSNLGYLKRFPIDALKIDMSFVRDIVHDPNDRAIVNAIIAMAKSLGMRTVAEGVETQAQAELLRARGCNFVQVYLYGAPAPAAEFIGMLGAVHG